MLDHLFTVLVGQITGFFLPFGIAANIMLTGFNVYGSCDPADVATYQRFKENISNGVILFNHPTFFDHIVLIKELNDMPRFAMTTKYMVGPIKWIAKKFHAIGITPNTGSAAMLAEEITNRVAGDPLIAVSPSGGITLENPTKLVTFRTGAFLTMPNVLPIVIAYKPYENWDTSLSLWDVIMRRLHGPRMYYRMKVLSPVYSLPNETPATYAARCRTIMEDALHNIHTNEDIPIIPHGSPTFFASSFLFLLCSIITFVRRNFKYGIGMLITFITSFLYHGTGNYFMRKVDMITNIIVATFYTFFLAHSRQIMPIGCLGVALASYLRKWNHALFVHFPIAAGFLSIRAP